MSNDTVHIEEAMKHRIRAYLGEDRIKSARYSCNSEMISNVLSQGSKDIWDESTTDSMNK